MAKKRFSNTEVIILCILSMHDDGYTAAKFIEYYEIPKASVYRALKRLIENGFVKEKHNIYYITKSGEKAVDELPPE